MGVCASKFGVSSASVPSPGCHTLAPSPSLPMTPSPPPYIPITSPMSSIHFTPRGPPARSRSCVSTTAIVVVTASSLSPGRLSCSRPRRNSLPRHATSLMEHVYAREPWVSRFGLSQQLSSVSLCLPSSVTGAIFEEARGRINLILFRMLARSNVMLGLALTFVFTTPVCDVVHRQNFVL